MKVEADFKLDGLFDLYRSESIFEGLPIVHEFPDYMETMDRYEALIRNASAADRQYNMLDGRQYYSRLVTFDSSGQLYCTYIWDIEKAIEMVQTKEVAGYSIPLDLVYDNVDHSEIQPRYVEMADPTVPILTVDFDPLNLVFAIDGNHRIVRRVQDAGIDESIAGFFFTPQQHMELMTAPIFQTIYKIQHNLCVITNYKLGNISWYEYEGKRKETSLYRI